jgi:hypothetical protein
MRLASRLEGRLTPDRQLLGRYGRRMGGERDLRRLVAAGEDAGGGS